MKTVQSAEAAAKLDTFREDVHEHNESIEMRKEPPCTSHDLAKDLAATEVTPAERRAFISALAKGQKSLKPRR